MASEAIDVLAVMDTAQLFLEDSKGEVRRAYADRVCEARAAVAELIEASRALRTCYRTTLDVNCKCDDEFIDRQTAEFDAALARIGSAA